MTEPEMPQQAPYALHLEPGEYWWCACGRSASQPFCDGSHKGGPFTPMKFVVTRKARTQWLCGCKRSKHKPFCDGRHNRLKDI